MKAFITSIALILTVSAASAQQIDCARAVDRKNSELNRIEQVVVSNMGQSSAYLNQRPSNFACAQKSLLAAIDAHDQYADKDSELLALLQGDCDLTQYTALKSRVEGRVTGGGDQAFNDILRQDLTTIFNQVVSSGQTCN